MRFWLFSRIECRANNSGLVLASLEMRIRETEEDLAELSTIEEVGKELHGVCAQTGDILVALGLAMLRAQCLGFCLDVFGDCRTDLHAYVLAH